MLGSAVSRKVWEEACAATDLRKLFNKPIDFRYNACMRKALETTKTTISTPQPVSVFFDSRQQNLPFWNRLGSGYERFWADKVAGYSFSSMEKVLPLQAADMVAYEIFVLQCERERSGDPKLLARPNMTALLKALPFKAGFFTVESLVEFAAYVADV